MPAARKGRERVKWKLKKGIRIKIMVIIIFLMLEFLIVYIQEKEQWAFLSFDTARGVANFQ